MHGCCARLFMAAVHACCTCRYAAFKFMLEEGAGGVKIPSRRSCLEVFYKIGVPKNFAIFTGKCYARFCNFIKKETLTQVLSCEFREIFKNTSFDRIILSVACGPHEKCIVAAIAKSGRQREINSVNKVKATEVVEKLMGCKAFPTGQKQPAEVCYKRSWSLKFRNIHRKTPVMEFLFNKVYQKETLTQKIAKFVRTHTKNICKRLLLTGHDL